MRWMLWPRWWSLRRRVADLERPVAALEAGRPVIVQVGGGIANRRYCWFVRRLVDQAR